MSSSGHLVLVPELVGSPYARLEPELRKSFEVALHLGTAAALAVALRDEVSTALRELDAARIGRHALALLPPAIAALALERPIEERLGSARRVAQAQILAGIALAAADRGPARRRHEDATALDHALIGVGQAFALVPGVSRNGAALTAARLRAFRREAASRLSRHAALPVIVAAAGLKGVRLARRGLPAEIAGSFATGALAAAASTLASAGLVARMDAARSYRPFAIYRVLVGVTALATSHAVTRGAGDSIRE